VALEAGHNRLRILGKTDQEITEFQQKGSINPTTAIHAPIRGTIVQRKIGPGQYVGSGASDPVFIIGDVSTVWVVAYVRETEGPSVRVGQAMYFTVLACLRFRTMPSFMKARVLTLGQSVMRAKRSSCGGSLVRPTVIWLRCCSASPPRTA
jgi:hypothetical protein